MSLRRPTLILADDHPLVLEGLGRLLEPTYQVVARVSTGDALVEAAAHHRPELVVTDIAMPGLDGIEATRRLLARSPATRVVILSFYRDAGRARAALAAGAWGFLCKSAAPDEVCRALEAIRNGQLYIDPEVSDEAIRTVQPPLPHTGAHTPERPALTRREAEVVQLVGEGRSNQAIAAALGISITTVRTHLSSVYAKLGTTSRVELALFAAVSERDAPAR